MSVKIIFATFAVSLAAVSFQPPASAQTYFPAFSDAANGQPSQTVDRLKSQIPSDARAQAALPRRRGQLGAPNRAIRNESAWHGHFTLPEFDPQYHGSNGG